MRDDGNLGSGEQILWQYKLVPNGITCSGAELEAEKFLW